MDASVTEPIARDAELPRCGNGKIDTALGEACDDGNTRQATAAAADCQVEKDFDCPNPGKPCIYLVKCGDGMLGGIEQCDPPAVGAGCSAACKLEPGYVCDAPPAVPDPSKPAACHRTVCGDGRKEGTEACDDGNTVDGDGCSGGCSFEPDCSAGPCTSACGDAVKLPPEACDDGNARTETAARTTACWRRGSPAPMRPPALPTSSTSASPTGTSSASRWADRPVIPTSSSSRAWGSRRCWCSRCSTRVASRSWTDGACSPGVTAACPYDQQLTGRASFDQWYRDTTNVNLAVPAALLLARAGQRIVHLRFRGPRLLPDRQPGLGRVGARGCRDRRPDHQRRPRPQLRLHDRDPLLLPVSRRRVARIQRRRRRLDLRQPPPGAGSGRAAHAHGAHARRRSKRRGVRPDCRRPLRDRFVPRRTAQHRFELQVDPHRVLADVQHVRVRLRRRHGRRRDGRV